MLEEVTEGGACERGGGASGAPHGAACCGAAAQVHCLSGHEETVASILTQGTDPQVRRPPARPPARRPPCGPRSSAPHASLR